MRNLVSAAFLVVLIYGGAVGQTYNNVTYVIAGGGGMQSVGSNTLITTIGQSIVGTTTVGTSANHAGFVFQFGGRTGSPPHTGIFSVTTVTDTGTGSLRWALLNANATAGLNIIEFNIPGPGVKTIAVTSRLPEITDPVIIDGYTQPGSNPNTNGPGSGSNAVILIELNGAGSPGGNAEGCLKLRTTGSIIRGLAINRSPAAAIFIGYGGGNNVVEGNFIGTNAAGTLALGNAYGIQIEGENGNRIGGSTAAARNVISGNTLVGVSFGSLSAGGANHIVQGNLVGTNAAGSTALPNGTGIGLAFQTRNILIGGTTPESRNVISGNTGRGINVSNGVGSPGVSRNIVQGNFIGTDVSGTAAVPNGTHGVGVYGLSNTVGGAMPGAGNVIAGNNVHGIDISGGDSTVIQGNYIGVNPSGTFALGNRGMGINIISKDVLVGGAAEGEGNVIANNGTSTTQHAGVFVGGSGIRNTILGNSIFANIGLGIDLSVGSVNGVTPNDSCDTDTLVANNYQNYPVLTSIQSFGDSIVVEGSLNSRPWGAYRIEFFSSPDADVTQYGEGRTYLGFTQLFTTASCSETFIVTLPRVHLGESYICATATDAAGNTSEFSRSIAAGTTSVSLFEDGLPSALRLEQNFPNPFNPSTKIRFSIPTGSSGHTLLRVYDILGREVATLVDADLLPGTYSFSWDAMGFSSGTYFYRLTNSTKAETKRLIILK